MDNSFYRKMPLLFEEEGYVNIYKYSMRKELLKKTNKFYSLELSFSTTFDLISLDIYDINKMPTNSICFYCVNIDFSSDLELKELVKNIESSIETFLLMEEFIFLNNNQKFMEWSHENQYFIEEAIDKESHYGRLCISFHDSGAIVFSSIRRS